MSSAQSMLAEFEQEAVTTRKFLERLPQDKLDWRPHPKSMSAGQLALHIATAPGGIVKMALPDSAPVPDFGDGRPAPASVREVLDALDESIATVRKVLPVITDERLRGTWTGTVEGKPVLSMPRGAFLRSILLNHWYHHRGQL